MGRFIPRLLRNASLDADTSRALVASLADAKAIQPDPPELLPSDILADNITSVESVLERGRAHVQRLEIQHARITEELRQSRLTIAAYELAHKHMLEGTAP